MMKDWTPREQLATFAMQGILAGDTSADLDASAVAKFAFEVADAMLAHPKEKRQPPEESEAKDE